MKKNIVIAFFVMFCISVSGFFLTCQTGPDTAFCHDSASTVILSDLCDTISGSAGNSVPSNGTLKHNRSVGQHAKRSSSTLMVNPGRIGRCLHLNAFSLFAESMLRFPSGLAEMSHHLISLGKLLN